MEEMQLMHDTCIHVMCSVCQAYRHYKTKHAECIYIGKINPIYIFYPSYIQRTVVLAQAPPPPPAMYITQRNLSVINNLRSILIKEGVFISGEQLFIF